MFRQKTHSYTVMCCLCWAFWWLSCIFKGVLGVTWCTCTFLKASFICVLSPLRWFWIQVQLPPDWGPSTSGGVQAFQQDLPQQKQQGYEIIKTEQRRRYANCRVSRFIFSLSWLLTCSLHVLIELSVFILSWLWLTESVILGMYNELKWFFTLKLSIRRKFSFMSWWATIPKKVGTPFKM